MTAQQAKRISATLELALKSLTRLREETDRLTPESTDDLDLQEAVRRAEGETKAGLELSRKQEA